MTTLKELLARNKTAVESRVQHEQRRIEATMPLTINQPVKHHPDSFGTLLDQARAKAEARIAEERRAEQRERAQLRAQERLAEDELTRMLDEGGPVRYEPSTEVSIWEGVEEVEGYDGDEYDEDSEAYIDFDDRDYVVDDIMAGVRIKPDPSQEDAVRRLAKVRYGCLIGAAGTGKTTTTRLLLHTLINGDSRYGISPLRLGRVNLRAYHLSTNEAGEDGEAAGEVIPSIAFCAYTGQATQVLKRNMPGNWQKNVFTIHSLLGFFPETYFDDYEKKDKIRFVPYYTKANKMPWDVIFVDEASMVAIDLWHMLLDAAKPGCRFYFIGDLNQLPPPVGIGVLGFALAKWTVAELTHVHRQSDDTANRIVDTAHSVLKGREIEFDDPATNPNWRVIGFKLDHDTQKAYQQVVAITKQLATRKDQNGEAIYDPWRDRVITAMNGFDDNNTASLVGQYPINDALSQLFADPNEPRVVISCQRDTKKFAVGYRVMATKNESPAELNRVTNGLTGRIEEIEENPKWIGDRRLVGDEHAVRANRVKMIAEATNQKLQAQSALERAHEAVKDFDWGEALDSSEQGSEKNSGPSSHIVTVRFDNGAVRRYTMNAQVEQLQIAYASTTHKTQGAEMPTAIIVVHHASRQMLCRENLYTAITRASRRVIILYSEFGLRIALANQKITGATMDEKLRQYYRMLGEGAGSMGFKTVNVRLEGD